MLSKRQVSGSERADFHNSKKLKGGGFRYQNLNNSPSLKKRKKMDWATVYAIRVFLIFVFIIMVSLSFYLFSVNWIA
ncbi:MAG: hypothetical protein ABH864_03460, partial [archaeon]